MNHSFSVASPVTLPERKSPLAAWLFRYGSRLRNLRYHYRNTSWERVHAFERERTGRSWLPWPALLLASWRHGASFEDYYHLCFYKLSTAQRRDYLTLSLNHEMVRQSNHPDQQPLTRDKALFAKHFRAFIGRKIWTWDEMLQEEDASPPGRLVFKYRWGGSGNDVHFPAEPFADWDAVRAYMRRFGRPEHYICEQRLSQHPELAELNPDTLNTLRVMTYLHDPEHVDIWCVILRVGVGDGADNWAQGGLCAWVDEDGTVPGPALLKNPFRPETDRHPHTGVRITGRQIPCYAELRQLAIASARHVPELRTVGWDIGVTPEGPVLIEGNDRCGHEILQGSYGGGCRHLANTVCDIYQVYD
ncbi:MAG TPA: sugar-transfer associated ATP-grasp domain-containing protein [Candidatus Obscuribacterales bacterium]